MPRFQRAQNLIAAGPRRKPGETIYRGMELSCADLICIKMFHAYVRIRVIIKRDFLVHFVVPVGFCFWLDVENIFFKSHFLSNYHSNSYNCNQKDKFHVFFNPWTTQFLMSEINHGQSQFWKAERSAFVLSNCLISGNCMKNFMEVHHRVTTRAAKRLNFEKRIDITTIWEINIAINTTKARHWTCCKRKTNSLYIHNCRS